MENWAEIRRRVLADGLSGRAACREYKIHWKTLKKILDNPEPPGYRRTKPKRPSILDPLLPVVHQILEDDKKAPKPPNCPVCKMALSAKKDKKHPKSVTIGKKTYYCCSECKMDAPKPGKKAK